MSQSIDLHVCLEPEKAPAGESDIGGAPLEKGIESGLDTLSESTKGFDGLFAVLSWLASAIFLPITWFIGLAGFVAAGLGFIVQILFPIAATMHQESDLGPEPVVLTCALTIVIVRILAIPITLRAQTRSVKMQLLAPHIKSISKKYANDRTLQAKETQRIQRLGGTSPLGCAGWNLLTIFLYAGVWNLFNGLTIRSASGAFAPDHVSPDSAIAQYLSRTVFLLDFEMNLTATVWQVGICWTLLPYLLTIVVSGLISGIPLHKALKLKNLNGAAAMSFGGSILLATFFPPMILLVRVVDSLFMLLLQRFTNRRARRLWLTLREDPHFRRAMGAPSDTFMPNKGADGHDKR